MGVIDSILNAVTDAANEAPAPAKEATTKAPDGSQYAIDPTGHAVRYDPGNEQYLRDTNQQLVSEAQAKELAHMESERDSARRYGTLATEAQNILGDLTMGGSDAKAIALAGVLGPEAQQKVRQAILAREMERGILSRGAGMAATAVPMLMGGGEASLGESLLAKALPGLSSTAFEGAAGSAAKMALNGAVDGALINLAGKTNAAVVHDAPMSAEALAMAGGEGALMGGLMGGAIGSLGAGASKLANMSRAARASKLGRVMEEGITEEQAVAMRGFGARSDADMEKFGVGEGYQAVNKNLKEYHAQLEKHGSDLGAIPSEMHAISKANIKEYEAAQNHILGVLNREAQSQVPSIGRLLERVQKEVYEPYAGTYHMDVVEKMVGRMERKLTNVVHANEGQVWSTWFKSLNQIEKDVAGLGVGAEVKNALSNVFKSEFNQAMGNAAKAIGKDGLAEQFQAAGYQRGIAEHMSEMSKNMLFEKVSKAEPLLRPTDWMIAVSGATFSHPIFAGSMLGLKAAGRALNQYFGPRQAESAFQASVGAKAAGAAARSSMGIREAVGALFEGGAKGAMGQRARYVGPKTMKEFNHSVDRVNDLMSPDHQRRVKDYAEALRSAGYSQLADATVKMNANAIQYLQQGRPASTKVKNMGLTKQPKAVMPSASDMKWFRKAEVVTNPDSVLASISNGTVGKDEIDAYKAVYPSHYEELVTAARDRVAHAINAGETLDVGKVATLGLVLGSAVHPMLQKGYVDAVQATFQQQEQQQSPPPDQKPMDVTDYKTPLERTLT